jgi:heptosyltransferase III
MLKDAIDFYSLKNVLVIKLRHHGDVLLTSPVFEILKTSYPHLNIDALVYLDTAAMLTLHPAIHQVHVIDRQWKKLGIRQQIYQEWRLFQHLRKQQYDLIIHLTEHHRGALLTRLLRPQYAVAPQHRKGKWYRSAFTHLFPILPGNTRHTVEMHLDAIRRLGAHPQTTPHLTLIPGESAEHRIQELLEQHHLKKKKFLVFHPTSRWLFKTWTDTQSIELIHQLHEHKYPIVITAGPDAHELQVIDQLNNHCGNKFINLAGKLSLKELAALIHHAHLFVGFDSVPAHIAAAQQTPAVVLFGPSGEKEWHPWQVPHRVLTTEVSCRPCGQAGCGNSWRSDCLEKIQTHEVMKAIKELWNA